MELATMSLNFDASLKNIICYLDFSDDIFISGCSFRIYLECSGYFYIFYLTISQYNAGKPIFVPVFGLAFAWFGCQINVYFVDGTTPFLKSGQQHLS